MRFLPRYRKSSHESKSREASTEVRDECSEDKRVTTDKLVLSWKEELEREHAPAGHCLSFLKGNSKRQSILDEDYIQSPYSKPVTGALAAANRVATESVVINSSEVETREPHPISEVEMKQQTMMLINKTQFAIGDLKWDEAAQLIHYWTKQGSEESVHLSIILLDRIIEEHEKAKKWNDSQVVFLLKAVIQNWKGQQSSLRLSPKT
jgi:hypothetical protein